MTEEEAKAWLGDVPRETIDKLTAFAAMVSEEAALQNLVAASTLPHIWARHIVDSAQLLEQAGEFQTWLDLGSGAGFPGIVVAILRDSPVTLVESRPRRADFLRRVADALDLAGHASIIGDQLERIRPTPYSLISARAFAPLARLLTIAVPFATRETRWLLPKGRTAVAELASVTASWQGDFRIVPSVTDPESAIIVATNVRPRETRR